MRTFSGALGLLLIVTLAACGRGEGPAQTPTAPATIPQVAPTATSRPTATPEHRYSQLLDRDDIMPIYEPEFAAANDVDLDDRELVLGVAIESQARAYPIRVMTYSEMVNDELAGIPILATW